VKRAKAGAGAPDGLRASQFQLVRSEQEQKIPPEIRARRDALELEVVKLRDNKAKTERDEYYQELEPVLVDWQNSPARLGHRPDAIFEGCLNRAHRRRRTSSFFGKQLGRRPPLQGCFGRVSCARTGPAPPVIPATDGIGGIPVLGRQGL